MLTKLQFVLNRVFANPNGTIQAPSSTMLTTLRYIFNRVFAKSKLSIYTTLHTTKYVLSDLAKTKRFKNRFTLFDYSIQCSRTDGLFLEFGVASGESINYIASLISSEKIYGFDCFKGLPENWSMLPKGHFRTDILPPVRENVELVVGLFQNTLDKFLQEHENPVRFLHLDADLYSSTIYVLKELIEQRRIQEGTVVQFDELFNYDNWWKEGEYRAFQEMVKRNKVRYEILGYSLDGHFRPGQVTIRLKR